MNKMKDKNNEEELIINISSDNKKDSINSKDNIINNNSISKKINDDADKEIEKYLKNKEIKYNKIFRKKNKKLNIKIRFETRESSIKFPLDDSKSVTKVLRLKSKINGNIYLKTDIDLIRNGNDK